ncbi:MAG: GNAT family N-acetyltransferase [Acidobacteria bacterium]|nr:GNAT family N-acetyltransferase [Acidobacteriota bacterium]MBV9477686.1 GNAT family N-acetyltransferase [Acidobacteriota bacterium]
MRAHVYESIDEIGAAQLAPLPTGLDFSFGLLRAMERSLWGELHVRYLTVEDDGTVVAFTPVYVGSNLNFNALLPKAIQTGYDALVSGVGSAIATRVAVTGCLISDRGWIPMHPELTDHATALQLLLRALDGVAKQHHAQLAMLKDIHRDFPAEDRAVFRRAGYTEGFSLPTIRINTAYASFEDYLTKQLSKNGRKHARKQFHKAEGTYTLRAIEDFESMIPRVFPLHRAVFLKAKYQFEELGPRFFVECARTRSPRTELVVCERNDGHIAGSLMIFYDEREQQNKRIGIDYDLPDSGLIYNLLNYTGIQRAIERGIQTLWLGQSSYVPKTRLGGTLEDQYLYIKAYDPLLKPTLPLQRWWMSRYSAAHVLAGVEQGVSL